MIHPNELRSGNYVFFKHCDYDKNIPRKINYILYPNCVGLQNISVNRIEYNDIEEIKLNEKIISDICGELNALSGDYRIQVTDEYSMSFSLDNDMIYIGDVIEIRISEMSVHRLQNIFLDLSGKELKINL